jgi:hypothetical protein
MADQVQIRKANNNAPRSEIVLIVGNPDSANGTVPIRAIVFIGNKLAENIELLFYVDGALQLGSPPKTNAEGQATTVLKIPSGAAEMKVKAEAIMSGRPSREVTFKVNLPKPAAHPSQITIVVESVKRGEGCFGYYLAMIDTRTNQTVAGKVKVMSKRSFLMDGKERKDHFTLSVPVEGKFFEITTKSPGHQEIDLIPEGYPLEKKQLDIYGPPRLPVKASRRSSGLVKFFDGCI